MVAKKELGLGKMNNHTIPFEVKEFASIKVKIFLKKNQTRILEREMIVDTSK